MDIEGLELSFEKLWTLAFAHEISCIYKMKVCVTLCRLRGND